MQRKAVKIKAKIGVGQRRIESVTKEIRKRYGPMLKQLAGQRSAKDHERRW